MKDVVIVGASVAGAATAKRLAEKGLSVQILERDAFPRRKSCGEGVFPSGVEQLRELGIHDRLLNRSSRLDSLLFELDGRVAEAPIPHPGLPALGVQRAVLDAELLDAAVTSGAELCAPVRATGLSRAEGGRYGAVETAGGVFPARFIIAADGLNSTLRQRAGLDSRSRREPRYGVSAHWLAPGHAQRRVEVHFRPGCEVYLTPVGDGLVNAALLLSRREARRLGGRLNLAFAEIVAGLLPSGAEQVEAAMAMGPFPAQASGAWRQNLLLVGDAAGFYDGLSGEGISLALRSSAVAAAAVSAFLSDGDAGHLVRYAATLRRLQRNSTVMAACILALSKRRRLGSWTLRNLARRPETLSRLIAVNDGAPPLSSLGLKDLLAVALGV